MDLFGNVAIVTGGASVLGFMTARTLYRAGAFIYLTDRNERAGRDAVESLRGHGHDLQVARFFGVDTQDRKSAKSAAQSILAQTDRVDIFVNVIDTKQTKANQLEENILNSFLPLMMRRNGGNIINVAGNFSQTSASGETFAIWSKSAVIAPTRILAKKMVRYGISVNCICIDDTGVEGNVVRQRRRIANAPATPSAVAGYPAALVDATLMFAKFAAGHITGQALRINL